MTQSPHDEKHNPETAHPVAVGDVFEMTIDRMAHGGEGIGHAPDGRVVFVHEAFPGDVVSVTVTKAKKSFAHAQLNGVIEPGPHRVASVCPAAELGAGCCDFAELSPASEMDIKATILVDQLQRVAKTSTLPDLETINLNPHRGWRTRVRLGVDNEGRAGTRKRGSNEIISDVACSQLAPGLVDGLVGVDARRFTPGAEVIAVLDSEGTRHVVETMKAPRGRRVEKVTTVIEGSGEVNEVADGHNFHFPATAFWQAHVEAPDTYSQVIREFLNDCPQTPGREPLGWDLYGGVGVFVPAIARTLGAPEKPARVISVDYSPAATALNQSDLEQYEVDVVSDRVEKVAAQLPGPTAVVMDPPRTGAGRDVVSTVASVAPQRIVHVGCDPATFARDIGYWNEHGFKLDRLTLVNAFPGTHHFEVIALLVPGVDVGNEAEEGSVTVSS
ncbi:class I SAM-dependent RNA methyltransferase [Corynebacterium sp. L4756]|uniref:class I SAM-dependent RNA methyltransferase n=1 Tax=unclassified Corynebacterium TaxID=2624378 RepID=UPI00374D2BA1